MAIFNRDTDELDQSCDNTVKEVILPKDAARPTGGANLPASLFEEYDNMSFLVSRLRIPVSLGDLVQ
jgi:hypothetical protein